MTSRASWCRLVNGLLASTTQMAGTPRHTAQVSCCLHQTCDTRAMHLPQCQIRCSIMLQPWWAGQQQCTLDTWYLLIC